MLHVKLSQAGFLLRAAPQVPVSQWIWTPRGFRPPVGPLADLDPPWSKSASGYGPPFADLDPPTKLSF